MTRADWNARGRFGHVLRKAVWLGGLVGFSGGLLFGLAPKLAVAQASREGSAGAKAEAVVEPAASSDVDADPGSDVEEMIVYGVKMGELDAIPAASTSTVYVDDFRAENKDLAALLEKTEGLSVRRFGGPGDSAELSIRGSSPNQVVVTLDGIRANSALTGGFDLSRVCLPLVERVEITRGAGSTEQGSGAVGGAVNVVTRTGEGGPGARAEFSGGAFETYEGSLLVSGDIGRFDVAAGYCGFSTEGDFEFQRPVEIADGIPSEFTPASVERINNERVQHGGNFAIGMPLGAGTLRFSDYVFFSSGGEPGIDSSSGETAGQLTRAHSRDVSNLAQLRFESPSLLRESGELDAAIYHRFERARFREVLPQSLFTDPIQTDVRFSTAGLRLHEAWSDSLFGQANDLDIRFDYAAETLDSDDQEDRDRHRIGAALIDSVGLFDEKLTLSAGARLDWTQGFDPQLLPEVGVVYAPFSWLRIRGHASRAYRAPNFDELFRPDDGFIRGEPDLQPEDAWNFDAGVELAIAELGPFSDLKLGASWFRREIDESIVFVVKTPRTIAPENTGSATSGGYELTAAVSWTRFLSISANHTQTDSRRDRGGARLAGQASEETTGRLRVGPEEVWKLVAEVQRVGKMLVNTGGLKRLPARTVWNASASVDLAALSFLPVNAVSEELWVYIEGANLSDVAVRDSISFPQPGRRVTAGVEVSW
ncbi:MAG: TonB-dependent receptor plug domain-containing protein [Myxococcota bacterium]